MIDKIARPIAKAGYLARGLIYLTIGYLALLTILEISKSGKLTDSKGAIQSILQTAYGSYALYLLIAGLICYSTWRILQSLLDFDDHGIGVKGIAIRTGLLISSTTHLLLAFYCFKLLKGVSDSKSSKQEELSYLLDIPFGKYIVITIGLILFVFGLGQIKKAFSETYKKYMNFNHKSSTLNFIIKFGLASRALFFFVIGAFIIYAGISFDSNNAKGFDQVWTFIGDLPFGGYLIFITALGLTSYGVYSILESIYREVELDP